MMIKVVLWDIDGTLLDFKQAEVAAIRQCFADVGFGQCPTAWLKDYQVINHRYWQLLEQGLIQREVLLIKRFEEFFGKYGLDVSKAVKFNELYQRQLGTYAFYNQNGEEVVKRLKGRVLQCAVTNGTGTAQRGKLAKSGLDQLLDHIFISEELGYNKPDVAFFDAVFAQIGFYPKDEVLIVGDSFSSDIQGGINAGIKTCYYGAEACGAADYSITDLLAVEELIMW